jgi:hypothetical protein
MNNQLPQPETKPPPEEALEKARAEKRNGTPETDERGIHECPDEVLWTTRGNAAKLLTEAGFPISGTSMYDMMKVYSPDAPFKIIRATNNRAEIGFRFEDAKEAAGPLIYKRVIAPESGIFTSKAGKIWASVSALKRKHGISTTGRILKGVKTIEARTHTGRPVKLYDMETAETRLQPLIKKIKRGVLIDQNGCYRNGKGTWITPIEFFASLSREQQQKTSKRSLMRFAQNHCKSLPVITLDRDGNKKLTKQNVHPIDELKEMPALGV